MLHYILLLLDLKVLLVFLCVFFVTLAYLKSCRPTGMPPGPPTVPFIGNVNLLSNNNKLHRTFFDLGRKYGSIFSIQLGWYPAVVINDYDLLKDALITNGNQCSDRFTHNLLEKILSKGETLGIINSEGQIWKASRRLATRALRDIGLGKATIEHNVMEETQHFLAELSKQSKKPFNLSHVLFRKATSNIMCTMLFGERYNYEDDDFTDILKTLETFFDKGNIFLSPNVLIPYLLPLLFMKSNSSMKMLKKMQDVMTQQIKVHRENFDPENVRDFIDVFLEAERQNGTDIVYSEKNCSIIILNLFMAGTDTTSGTLSWLMLFMLRHPDIQARCRKDILEVVGTERAPCWKDREHLPYIEATLCEAVRMANIAPHAVSHSTAGEVTLNGYTLPNDTVIIPDIYSIHMNPDVWEDPEEFRPQRFIDDEGKISKPPQFIPFSIGKRSCLGEHLARIELFILFTTMLQRLTFTCEDEGRLPTIHDGLMGLTLLPPPYEIQAHPV